MTVLVGQEGPGHFSGQWVALLASSAQANQYAQLSRMHETIGDRFFDTCFSKIGFLRLVDWGAWGRRLVGIGNEANFQSVLQGLVNKNGCLGVV